MMVKINRYGFDLGWAHDRNGYYVHVPDSTVKEYILEMLRDNSLDCMKRGNVAVYKTEWAEHGRKFFIFHGHESYLLRLTHDEVAKIIKEVLDGDV